MPSNQLPFPPSSRLPEETFQFLAPLYHVLFGSDTFQVNVHFTGSVEIDNDLTVHSSTFLAGWKFFGSGNDLVVWDRNSNEIVRFGDTLASYHFKVTGPAQITGNTQIGGNLTLQDWDIVLSGDDLVFQDDADQEIVRIGDTSSAQHLKVTGPAQVTGTLNVGGDFIFQEWTLVDAGDDIVFQDDAAQEIFRIGDTSSTWQAKVTGSFNVTGPATIGGQLTASGTFQVSSTTTFNGVVDFNNDVSFDDNVTYSQDLTGDGGVFTWSNSGNKRIEVGSTGIGFFGAAQVQRQTVTGTITGGTLAQTQTALKNLIDALDENKLGLITDSTT